MRFLADENFPGDAVAQLEAVGHDIAWVRDVAPGAKDSEILALAAREERILLTFDKDFGELARRAALPVSSGVMLFRLPFPAASQVGSVLANRIAERTDWAGHFTVIEATRIRMRSLTKVKLRR
jgi:predicted nuclease of predicted toxin-antitoxin system